MELSLKRDAHFDKIAFFVPGRFFDAKWTPNWSPNGAQKALKIDQKSDAFLDWKINRFLMKNGARGEPKGTPKSRNFGVFSRLLPRTPPKTQNGPNMTPKWSQNAIKMGSKWSQNGTKNEWNTSEKSSRHICVFWEFLLGFQTCSQWYLQTFCMKSVRHGAEFPEDFHWNSWRSRTELVGKSCGNRQGINWN